jgi:hypothetical protein
MCRLRKLSAFSADSFRDDFSALRISICNRHPANLLQYNHSLQVYAGHSSRVTTFSRFDLYPIQYLQKKAAAYAQMSGDSEHKTAVFAFHIDFKGCSALLSP